MRQLVVSAGGPLEGAVTVGGAKNSVLKLMAACLLAQGRHTLDNVPDISDVETMADILRSMNVGVSRMGRHELVLDVPLDPLPEAPWDLTERMRASVVLLGPLLARLGEARVPLPGGDDFGGRPIDFHVKGLSALGATLTVDHGYVVGRTEGRLMGSTITLEFASHTATDNLLLAAVLAKGRTVIENAAREPEVMDLAGFLRSMGAQIVGAGTSRIEVDGVEHLHAARHRVIGDRVEAATFLSAVSIAGGEILIEGARPEHLRMLLEKLGEMGLHTTANDEGILATAHRRLNSVDVATLPYPGVATDYKPLMVAMLAVADGVGIVTENLFFGGRFRYVDELRRMGADIRTEGHHALVRGVPRLQGVPVRATDIRAGAALVVAGLAADGDTVISGAEHIDRGYENLSGKLAALGASIRRLHPEAEMGSRTTNSRPKGLGPSSPDTAGPGAC